MSNKAKFSDVVGIPERIFYELDEVSKKALEQCKNKEKTVDKYVREMFEHVKDRDVKEVFTMGFIVGREVERSEIAHLIKLVTSLFGSGGAS